MKLIRDTWLVGLLLLAGCLGPAPILANAGSPTASISVDTLRQDFGTARQGEIVRGSFSISNEGSVTLIIESASFSMPGMSMRVTQRIDPGETTSLDIDWDTSGYSRMIEGQVTLQTNDPDHPKLVLTLAGTVIAPIEVVPIPAFYLSQFQGQSENGHVTIQNNQQRDIRLLDIDYESPLFSVQSEEVEQGKRFRLTVTVSPKAPVGRYREMLVVRTSDPDRPRIRLAVNILVKPDVYVNEEVIDFGQVQIASLKRNPSKLGLLTQSLIVSRRHGKMSIEDVESELPFLTFSTDPEGASQRIRVDVGLDPNSMIPGSYSSNIRLSTDDREFPELQVPVRIQIAE